jgi:hypothetical protein
MSRTKWFPEIAGRDVAIKSIVQADGESPQGHCCIACVSIRHARHASISVDLGGKNGTGPAAS